MFNENTSYTSAIIEGDIAQTYIHTYIHTYIS